MSRARFQLSATFISTLNWARKIARSNGRFAVKRIDGAIYKTNYYNKFGKYSPSLGVILSTACDKTATDLGQGVSGGGDFDQRSATGRIASIRLTRRCLFPEGDPRASKCSAATPRESRPNPLLTLTHPNSRSGAGRVFQGLPCVDAHTVPCYPKLSRRGLLRRRGRRR